MRSITPSAQRNARRHQYEQISTAQRDDNQRVSRGMPPTHKRQLMIAAPIRRWLYYNRLIVDDTIADDISPIATRIYR